MPDAPEKSLVLSGASPGSPALVLRSQAEILPGYTLLERLGSGTIGEVWKASAPGGLCKAIKVSHGSLKSIHGSEVQEEVQALTRAINLRHPFLLALDRFDVVDGQLVIVMELADGSLWDRLQLCRAQGQLGIPRDELLGYLEETAEALDYLADVHHLQHLDVKPQNLLLFGNHVKVSDFGLIQPLEAAPSLLPLRSTPAYAPPELQESRLSRTADQYSLAIAYVELLTGARPFRSPNPWQLLLQHSQAAPNLEGVPAEDRAAVTRALAKIPSERFPTCEEFVAALGTAPARRRSGSYPTLPGPAALRVSPAAGEPAAARNRRPEPGPIPTSLLDDLQNPDLQVCWPALLTLRRLGPEARSAVGVCGKLLNHPEPSVRWETLQILEQLGPEARAIQPTLTTALNDPKDYIRTRAADLLVRLDARMTPVVVAQLSAVVVDPNCDCLLALQTLARLGPGAQPAIPAILQALRGRRLQGTALRQAIRTLAAIGLTTEAVPLVQALLVHADAEVRAAAQTALDRFRKVDRPAAPAPDSSHVWALALARIAGYRERRGPNELVRVQRISRCLAEEAARTPPFAGRIDARFIQLLEQYAPLQDIGKAALPDAVLLKPARLGPDELRIMQTHTVIGAETLRGLARQEPAAGALQMAIDIVRHHHECYDGSGYPDRLAGEQIPLAARLVALADVYTALRSERVYRKAVTHPQAVQVMTREAEGRFDPQLFPVFLRCSPLLDRMVNELSA